jgi:uncharacterized protein (TIGR02147 family)
VAVRELLAFYKFNGDYKELAKSVDPPISPSQAKKAITLLERLRLIKKGPDGFYSQTDNLISTGYDAKTVAINNFQLSTLDLAKESIDRFPKQERDISTLTLSFSGPLYHTLSEKLKNFRRELLELVKNDPNPVDRVYQINFQIFPLSKYHKGASHERD